MYLLGLLTIYDNDKTEKRHLKRNPGSYLQNC